MSEIDMIPREYRDARRLRKTLRLFVVVFMLMPVAGLGFSALIKWRLTQGEVRLAQLRSASAVAQSGSAAIEAARAHKAMIAQALVSLTALRGAGDAVRVADGIEAALSADISLDQVNFGRDAQLQAPSAPPAAQLVLPASPLGGAGAETWQLSQRLELSGAATSYPALTSFLGKLSAQPGFAQVRLVRSSVVTAPGRPQPASPVHPAEGVQFTINAALERLP